MMENKQEPTYPRDLQELYWNTNLQQILRRNSMSLLSVMYPRPQIT